jgi:ribosomal protein L29
MKTIEFMQKTIKELQDDLNNTKTKLAELNLSTSSNDSPPLMKK